MLVDIGVDRMHHAFWRYMDPRHPKHVPGNSFASAIHDYYVFIDGEIRQLLELVDDGAVVLVISDHGAKPILGGICINDWLIENGYLVLKEQPSQPTSLAAEHVDWSPVRASG